MDEFVSIPICDGRVKMQDLRDFCEATDDAPETASALVLADELQYHEVKP